jgi:SOS-response transcriptional repressor LexA
MSKRMRRRAVERPDWSAKILELRERLGVNQTSFGQILQSSAMAVSRWERGTQEPPSHCYIEMGNLSGDPGCWYFWARAGLRNEDVMRVMPTMRRRIQRAQSHKLEIVRAGSGEKLPIDKLHLVAVPLLNTVAASHGEKGDSIDLMHDAPADNVIAAPRDWCPHPSSTSCLRVRGNSMAPTIRDGCIIAVDSSQTNRAKLDGRIVVVWNKDAGLTVSRYRRYDHTEVLQPENSQYQSITLGNKKNSWKIVATVLWWISKAP